MSRCSGTPNAKRFGVLSVLAARTARRFPPPWSVDEMNNACFIVRDANGQALGCFYFENEQDRTHRKEGGVSR